jgi:hypothetical protein
MRYLNSGYVVVKLHQCVCCAKRNCIASVIFAGSIYGLLVYDILISVIEIIFYFVIIGDVLITAPCIFFLQIWCIHTKNVNTFPRRIHNLYDSKAEMCGTPGWDQLGKNI